MFRKLIGAAAVALLVLLALVVGYKALLQQFDPADRTAPANTPAPAPEPAHPSFLYGRVETLGGASYEGRLRWGGDEEAFWGDYFNGYKAKNPWVTHVPREQLKRYRPIEIFGLEIAQRERELDLGRPFMVRFGDTARIEARGKDVRVTLKSGTAFKLDRFSAGDFDDGVRVWDARQGVVDLDSLQVRTIELLPSPSLGAAPDRLHGTVRTRQGEFTGFVQWNREKSLGLEELDGQTAEGEVRLRFNAIRAIGRRSQGGFLVTLLDGGEVVLSDSQGVGRGNRGIYVDDPRYGRVLVSRDAFERVDFSPGGAGPAFGDFPPGSPLTGSVTTRAGRRLGGRLVYDLDESETTETLDAPSRGVDYTIPFGRVASIRRPAHEESAGRLASVILHGGEELRLEPRGDLGEDNAGMLIFVDGDERIEYVPWSEVERVEFDRPPAMDPPLGNAPGEP